jgi:hypothetical protein
VSTGVDLFWEFIFRAVKNSVSRPAILIWFFMLMVFKISLLSLYQGASIPEANGW